MKKFFKEFASSFLSDVVNFIFMAFVLFCLLKAINKLTSIGHKAEEPKAPTTKNAPSVPQIQKGHLMVCVLINPR